MDHTGIRVRVASVKDVRGAKLIDKAVSDAWNGSLSHASVIAKLIRVGKGLASRN
jgi:hypothetical protein